MGAGVVEPGAQEAVKGATSRRTQRDRRERACGMVVVKGDARSRARPEAEPGREQKRERENESTARLTALRRDCYNLKRTPTLAPNL